MRGRRETRAGAFAMMALVAGCQAHEPKGQVVATVEGKDVTRRDVAAEIAAANLPKDTDMKAIQPQVVSDIVNRKLLVAQAKQEGLDKSPDYLSASKRAEELVLAQQLVGTWVRRLPPPSQADAQAYVDANPQMFADRRVYLLDQVLTGAQGLDQKALEPLQTMDAVVAYLTQQKHAFRRGNSQLDTLTLPADVAQRIAALAPGTPFVVNRGGMLTIGAVTQVKPAPVPEAQRIAIATQALQQQNTNKTIADHIKSLRTGAKIDYQPGFAPPKEAAAG